MKTNINYLLALCFLLLCACKSGNASSQSKSETPQDTIKSFTLHPTHADRTGTTCRLSCKALLGQR